MPWKYSGIIQQWLGAENTCSATTFSNFTIIAKAWLHRSSAWCVEISSVPLNCLTWAIILKRNGQSCSLKYVFGRILGLVCKWLCWWPIQLQFFCTTIELSSEWTKVLLFLITSNSKSCNHAEAHSGTSTWSLDNVCFFIKVTQLSELRYCENHTILFHWVCERAFQAKKVPSTNLNSHQKIGYHKYYTCQLALLRVICLKIKNVDHMHTRQFCMHNWQFKTTCSVTSEKRVNRLHCISPRNVYYRSNLILG